MAIGTQIKHAIITTKYRGVFYGEVRRRKINKVNGSLQVTTGRVVMVEYWGTTRGFLELTDTGPTKKSRISSVCPEAVFEDVTAVCLCSPEANIAWYPHLYGDRTDIADDEA